MALSSMPATADYASVRAISTKIVRWAEVLLVCIVIAIHSGAVVSLLQKLGLPGLGLVWAVGGILSLVLAAWHVKSTLRVALYGWPILLLTLWAWASYSWTVSPYETLRGAILISCTNLFAFAVAGRFSWQQIITMMAWTLVSLVGLSILLAVAVPSIGQMQDIHIGAWSGVWPEKQLLGIFSCHGLIACLAMSFFSQRKVWWWAGAFMCFVAIVGSTGKTALLMSFMALAMGLWLLLFHRGMIGAVIAGWLGLVFGAIGVLAVSGGLNFILEALGRSSDFTGRSAVWDSAKTLGKMRPDTGWGFQSVWRGEGDMTSPYQWIMEWTDFKPANAHSSWLDIFMQLGFPGLFLLALCMVWAWFGVLFLGAKDKIGGAYAGANLMAITFISFTETNLAGAMDLQWLFVPLLGAKLYETFFSRARVAPRPTSSGKLEGDTFTFSA
jgi:exopolysaccharide production protein ExoQ